MKNYQFLFLFSIIIVQGKKKLKLVRQDLLNVGIQETRNKLLFAFAQF